jgi:2-dehydropantoate 2-reductase
MEDGGDMRFLVLGAGAVGGYFGGRLAEAGADVTFLVRPPRAALLKERGLVIESPLGDARLAVETATADTLSGSFDTVILTAKHYDFDGAAAAIGPAVGTTTAILPLLNGLVHLDRLDAAFGRDHVLGGVAYIGATLRPDGGIRHHNRLSGITFGERAGGLSERVREIAAAFAGTPVTAQASDNVMLDMWEKFVFITAMAGMNCLMRGSVGDIMAAAEGEALARDFLAECRTVAAAAGFPPRERFVAQIEALLTERGSANSASMRHDLESGAPTEGEAILGDLLRRAREFGVATPLLRAAVCHLQVYEARRRA